jgi:hypothetical protein
MSAIKRRRRPRSAQASTSNANALNRSIRASDGDKKRPIKRNVISARTIQLSIVGALIVFLYARTIPYEYVGLDDKLLIVDNYTFIHDLGNMKAAFVNDVFYNPSNPSGIEPAYYRPLLTISLMIDSQFGQQSPGFYHVTNILFHLISCVLLLKFFKQMNMSDEGAFTGTVLFAVHPMLSQAIGWIPGRNDTMMTVFVLASLIYFIRFLETHLASKLWMHVSFFILAIFTKETAVFLPVICVAYYFLIHQPGGRKTVAGHRVTFLAAYMVSGLLWLFLRQQAISQSSAALSFRRLAEAFLENLPVYFQVVQKIVAPYNLSIMSIAKDTNYIVSAVVIIAIISLLAFSKVERWRYVIFGFIWFNVFLLPAFVVPVLTGLEHRAYLPAIGFLVMVFEIDYFKNLRFSSPRSFVGVAIVLSVFIVINVRHTPAFANKFAFWEKAASNSPHSSLAKLNYGRALAERGQTDEAINVYRQGLEINYREPMIHNNIGIIYAQRRMYPQAVEELKIENEVNPTYSDAFYNLGIVYENMGEEKDMLEAWQHVLSIRSNHALARKALDQYYSRRHRQ